MRFQHILFIIIISIVFAGCSSCEEQPTNVNKADNTTPITNQPKTTPDNTKQNSPNQNTENKNTPPKGDNPIADGLDTVPKITKKVEAVTLKPVLDAYCDAMRKKDNDALRKVFSTATLKSFEKDMRVDGIETLIKFLENEPVGNKCELVNEKIQGLTGEAVVITQTYPDGTEFKFVKENNEWKLTNESSDIDRVTGG